MSKCHVWVFFALLILTIQSCGTSDHVPIVELGQPPLSASNYTVVEGDTMFAIAWRFDMQLSELAGINNIVKPYTIFPGQRLSLVKTVNKSANTKRNQAASVATGPAKKTIYPKKTTSIVKNAQITGNIDKKSVQKNSVRRITDKGWIWPVAGKVSTTVKYHLLQHIKKRPKVVPPY